MSVGWAWASFRRGRRDGGRGARVERRSVISAEVGYVGMWESEEMDSED